MFAKLRSFFYCAVSPGGAYNYVSPFSVNIGTTTNVRGSASPDVVDIEQLKESLDTILSDMEAGNFPSAKTRTAVLRESLDK